MEGVEKVVLSNCFEFQLRNNVVIKVYPASLEVFSLLAPKLKEMDNPKLKSDMAKQSEVLVDVVYELIKDDNDIKKESLKKILTLEACVKIMQKALGSFGAVPIVK